MSHEFDPDAPVSTLANLPAGVYSADRKTFNAEVFGKLMLAARALVPVTLVQVAADTNIHHSTLSKMDNGKPVDLQKCAKVQSYFEHRGVEFVAGTREIALRFDPNFRAGGGVAITIDPTMPSGTRFIHPRALDLDDLLSALQTAGVQVQGEPMLRQILDLDLTNDWCGVLVGLARNGRKNGVRFIRAAAGGPSDRDLVEQLRAFPFADDEARRDFVRNIIAVEQGAP
ncbi:hypothetical protein [Achromobacter ruhlandii]|uniref:hypothetical protein n=1 Tax=Achromobacter ruhlandii TaxID=72557 RepID=UPI003BA3E002